MNPDWGDSSARRKARRRNFGQGAFCAYNATIKKVIFDARIEQKEMQTQVSDRITALPERIRTVAEDVIKHERDEFEKQLERIKETFIQAGKEMKEDYENQTESLHKWHEEDAKLTARYKKLVTRHGKDNEELRNQMSAMQSRMGGLEDKLRSCEAINKTQAFEILEHIEENRGLKRKLSEYKGKMNESDQKIQSLQAKLKKQRETIKRMKGLLQKLCALQDQFESIRDEMKEDLDRHDIDEDGNAGNEQSSSSK